MRRWVLVTRADEELEGFRAALRPLAIEVLAYPVLREAEIADEAGWLATLSALDRLQAVAFTSPRAPQALAQQAAARGALGRLRALPAAAVGAATARAAAAAGFAVTLTGRTGAGELARSLSGRYTRGTAVLHPCGRDHRSELGAGLAAAGIDVVELLVYAMDATPRAALPPLPETPPLAVVLTSPRAAAAYQAACGARYATAIHLAMGATTAAHVAEIGIQPVTLRRPTPAAVVEELCQTCS